MSKTWTKQLFDETGNCYNITVDMIGVNEKPEQPWTDEQLQQKCEVVWAKLELDSEAQLPAKAISQLCKENDVIDFRFMGAIKEWLLEKGILYKHTHKGNFYIGVKLKA
jgi:hypothetical protein